MGEGLEDELYEESFADDFMDDIESFSDESFSDLADEDEDFDSYEDEDILAYRAGQQAAYNDEWGDSLDLPSYGY